MELGNRVEREGADDRGGDSPAPVNLTEPISDFGGASLDISPNIHPDAANGDFVDTDRKVHRMGLHPGVLNPFFGIFSRIGVWERIAQIHGNSAVVGVKNERIFITLLPRADCRQAAIELHR